MLFVKYITRIFIGFCCVSLVLSGCLKSKNPGIPSETLEVLVNSGFKKPDLMKVLLNFDDPENSEKLTYAYFLISNIIDNYSNTTAIIDSNGKIIVFDIKGFQNYEKAKLFLDSIKDANNGLYYESDSIALDIELVNSSFLIKHINAISTIIEKSPWYGQYDIVKRCNYILPYRVGNEFICDDMMYLHDKYSYLIDSSVIQTSLRVNAVIDSAIVYDKRMELLRDMQSVMVTDSCLYGNRCDIAIYKVMVLRSLGIAAAMDYTPCFADSVLNNYSATVILPDGDELHLPNNSIKVNYPEKTTPKVYRRSFIKDSQSLFSIKEGQMHTPRFIGNYHYKDVTDHYVQTENLEYTFNDSIRFAYLAVKNDGNFVPVHWSQTDSVGKAVFNNMAVNIAYYPVIVVNKNVVEY